MNVTAEQLNGMRRHSSAFTEEDWRRAKETIAKLERITVDRGATPPEAEAARGRIRAILDKMTKIEIDFDNDERYIEWLKSRDDVWRMPIPVTVNVGWNHATQKWDGGTRTTYFVREREFGTLEEAMFWVYKEHAREHAKLEMDSEIEETMRIVPSIVQQLSYRANAVVPGVEFVGVGWAVASQRHGERIFLDPKMFSHVSFSRVFTGRTVDVSRPIRVGDPVTEETIESLKREMRDRGMTRIFAIEIGRTVFDAKGQLRIVSVLEGGHD